VSVLVDPPAQFPPSTFRELLDSHLNYKLYNDEYTNQSMFYTDLNVFDTELAKRLKERLTDSRPVGYHLIAVRLTL